MKADVGLALYLSEVLSTFEYKQQEEIMVVISQLSTVLSSCTPLVQTLEAAVIIGEPAESIEGKEAVIAVNNVSSEDRVSADWDRKLIIRVDRILLKPIVLLILVLSSLWLY